MKTLAQAVQELHNLYESFPFVTRNPDHFDKWYMAMTNDTICLMDIFEYGLPLDKDYGLESAKNNGLRQEDFEYCFASAVSWAKSVGLNTRGY